MLIKLPSGNKPDNDKLLLDSGFIVLDNESKGIRVHDGSTVGGFESIGIYEPPPPSEFLGEVPVSELISGDALASLVGLTVGTEINSNEPWLKFYDAVDAKFKFIAKKPYRNEISTNQLNAVDLVYGKTITIGANQYICRLIKGANSDPYTEVYGVDPEDVWGSEWNRLMYPICAPTGNPEYDVINDPTTPGLGAWANYDQESDLCLLNQFGRQTICQEISGIYQLGRGYYGVTRCGSMSVDNTDRQRGWRPLLELVQ